MASLGDVRSLMDSYKARGVADAEIVYETPGTSVADVAMTMKATFIERPKCHCALQ